MLLLPKSHPSAIGQAGRLPRQTYKAVEANPVRVLLVAAGAFDVEGVVVRVFLGINGLQGSNAARS